MVFVYFLPRTIECSDTSTENLSFLSSEQALGDVANFIVKTTTQYKLQGRKWIVFGGSYSGNFFLAFYILLWEVWESVSCEKLYLKLDFYYE